MFRRKPSLELSEAAYGYWLRAQRPPLEWFLGLDAPTQATLAELGDEYVADVAVAIGYGVADPALAEAGISARIDPEAEEDLLRRVSAEAAQRVLGREEAPDVAPVTMAGWAQRQTIRQDTEQRTKDEARSFLGRAPDAVRGAE